MRISDWSSDVCSSDLTAISWSSAARVRYCSTSTPAVRTSAVNAPPRVPTAGVPATRTTSKDQTPMTTAVRRKNVYRFKTRPYAHQKEALRQRSEEHTSELQSLMRNSYADFCLKKKKNKQK